MSAIVLADNDPLGGVLHSTYRAKGVEKQFRYNCELCDTCVGYRSVPYDQDAQYIYILPEVSPYMDVACKALKTVPPGLEVDKALEWRPWKKKSIPVKALEITLKWTVQSQLNKALKLKARECKWPWKRQGRNKEKAVGAEHAVVVTLRLWGMSPLWAISEMPAGCFVADALSTKGLLGDQC